MKIETYEDQQGQHRWRIRADNNEILADSGEGYKEERDRDAGVKLAATALQGYADALTWRPCETGFPDDLQTVLVRDEDRADVRIGYRDGGTWYLEGTVPLDFQATAWLPVPN